MTLKRITLTILFLLLLALPVLAQETSAVEVAQTEALTWRGMFLLAIALFFAVFGVALWLAKKLADAGDKRAEAFLQGVERGVKWIPTEEAAKYVNEFRADAAKTSTSVDDTLGIIAAVGVDVVDEFKKFLAARPVAGQGVPGTVPTKLPGVPG